MFRFLERGMVRSTALREPTKRIRFHMTPKLKEHRVFIADFDRQKKACLRRPEFILNLIRDANKFFLFYGFRHR